MSRRGSEEPAASERLISATDTTSIRPRHVKGPPGAGQDVEDESPRRSAPSIPEKGEPRSERKSKGRVLTVWLPEIATLSISVALVVAIIILLRKIDGTPLEKWSLPWNIKPNTLVSVLVTLCRLFMLAALAESLSQLKWVYFEQRAHSLSDFQAFDEASRGLWGSMAFLWKFRYSALVASLGATLVILAFAMDPLAQQLVAYEAREIISNDTAKIPIARAFISQNEDMSNSSRNAAVAASQAGLAALFGANTDVSFSCASGDCNWPAYESLAICSSCRDISNTTTVQCEGNSTGTCTYQTSVGYTLGAQAICGGPDDQGGLGGTIWNSTSKGALYWMGNISEANIAEVVAISFPAVYPVLNSTRCRPPMPMVWDCWLSWCVKTYASTSSTGGALTDVPTSSKPLVYVDHTWDPLCANSDGNLSSVVQNVPAFTNDTLPSGLACMGDVPASSSAAFWIKSGDWMLLGQTFAQYLTGYVFEGFNYVSYAGIWTQYGATNPILRAMQEAHDGDFPRTLEAMATAMTNQIRQGPNTTAWYGQTSRTSTNIAIKWPWLAYPAALVGLSLAFLVMTMVFSAEKNRVVWKSSSLPALFHGLRGWSKDELSDRQMGDMHETAKGMWVRLVEHDDEGFGLMRS